MGKYTERERVIQIVTDLVTVCLSKSLTIKITCEQNINTLIF